MADRELTINLRFVKAAAERNAQQFHQNEQRRIRETAEVQKSVDRERDINLRQSAKVSEDLGRQMERNAKLRAQNLDRLNQQLADNAIAAALKEHNARLRMSRELREVRIKGIQDEARAREQADAKALARSAAVAAMMKEVRIKATQEESAAVLKNQQDTADRIIRDMVDKQKAYLRLSAELRQARAKGEKDVSARQAEIQLEDDRNAARRRIVNYQQLARRQSEIAVAASQEMKEILERRLQYEKDGDTKAVAYAKDAYAQRAAVAKQAVESSNRYAEQAQKELNATVEGLEGRHARVIKGTFEERVKSAKGYANAAGQAYKEVETAANKSNTTQRTEVRKTNNALEEQQKRILSISTAYTTMRIAAEAGQFARMAIEATSRSLRESRDYIADMVQDMERFRTQAREIMAMRGEQSTAGNIARFAGEAAQAAVNTQEYAKFVEEFQAQSQEHIGAGKEFRLSDDQAKSLNQFAASYAASQGIDMRSAAQLMGTVIATAPVGPDGKVNEAKAREDFAKIAGTLQIAKGRTSKLMPQFAEAAQELGGEGGSVEDIRKLAIQFAAGSEINPNKAGVLIRAMYRGLRQVRMSDQKSDELGIAKKMTDEQALQRAVDSIAKIAKEEGVSENEVTGRYFNEIREYEALRAHVVRGQRGGLYARARRRQDDMTAADADRAIAEYRKSPEGIAQRQSAEEDQAKFRRASAYQNLTSARRQAAIGVRSAGEIEEPENAFKAIATAAGQQYGQGNRFEQETERMALRDIDQGLTNYPAGRAWLDSHGPLGVGSPEPLKAEAADLLDRLRKQGGGAADPNWRRRGTGINPTLSEGVMGPGAIPAPRKRLNVVLPIGMLQAATGRRMTAAQMRRMVNRADGGKPIEILTDGDRAARAASRAAGAAFHARNADDRESALAPSRLAAAEAASRAAASHAANAAYMAERRAAAHPAEPRPIVTPQDPNYDFGHGPLARAARGSFVSPPPMNTPTGPPRRDFPRFGAAINYGVQEGDHEGVHAYMNRLFPFGMSGPGIGETFSGAIKMMGRAISGPVPAAMPSRPTVMRN